MAAINIVLSVLLFVLGCLSGLFGINIMMVSKSSIHEIYGAVCFLTTAIFWSGAAIVFAVTTKK